MKRKLKVNDFFCGCGGMGIAFKNAGYEIAGAWDFDKYAVESYRANVGDHVQKADIKELHQADIPQADVWAFGFPCQDLSVAGKQRGMILKCEDCGEEIEINPEEYTGNTICPKCSSNNFKAASRSGCFFEMMRLLEETEREREHAMPAVIIAENVRGLRPYLPVLRLEYERHGYTAHIEMFNSKYWNVPQNRDRYAVVGTRNKKNLSFTFPKEQVEVCVVAVGKVTCVRTLPLTLYGPPYTVRSATRPVWHTWGMVCGLIFTLHQMMGRTAYNLYIMQRLLRVQRV